MLPMITCIKLTILQLVNMEPVVPLASFSRIVHPSSLSTSTGAESILRMALAQKNLIDISEALTKLHYFPLPLRLFLAVNEAASSMASKSNS